MSPALLQALGRLTVAFQTMEANLAHMISRVADIGGEIATIVTDRIPATALHAKVAALLRHHWQPRWESEIGPLLARTAGLIDKRNTMVHSLWYPTDSEGGVRYKAKPGAKGLSGFATVPTTEVERLASEIDEVAGELRRLGLELYPEHFQRHSRTKPPHSVL
jgi:hypothetical protein